MTNPKPSNEFEWLLSYKDKFVPIEENGMIVYRLVPDDEAKLFEFWGFRPDEKPSVEQVVRALEQMQDCFLLAAMPYLQPGLYSRRKSVQFEALRISTPSSSTSEVLMDMLENAQNITDGSSALKRLLQQRCEEIPREAARQLIGELVAGQSDYDDVIIIPVRMQEQFLSMYDVSVQKVQAYLSAVYHLQKVVQDAAKSQRVKAMCGNMTLWSGRNFIL